MQSLSLAERRLLTAVRERPSGARANVLSVAMYGHPAGEAIVARTASRLVARGYLVQDPPWVWQLTDEGRAALEVRP